MSPGARAALGAALLAGLLVLASRVSFTSDTARLLPPGSAMAEAITALRRFHVADTLLVEVDGSGADQPTLLAAVDDLGTRLSARPDIAKVRYRVGIDDALSLDRVRPWAVELTPRAAMAARLSPEGVRSTLEGQLLRLAGPAGALARRRLQADPLDLLTLTLEGLRAAQAHFQVVVDHGHLLSKDGQHAVLFVEPALPSTSVGPNDPFVASLGAELDQTALPVRWYGGHRIAAAAATGMKQDATRAGMLGGSLLLLVLLAGFRTLRPLLGALLPMSMAVAATGAAATLMSPLHTIHAGFAAALGGLAIDWWIHLYVLAAAECQPGDDLAARHAAALRALDQLRPGLLMGAGSTAGVFAILALSDWPVVRVLGLLGAAAVGGALLGTWLLGPLTFAVLGRSAQLKARAWQPKRGARWAVGGLTLGALALAPFAGLDGDPRDLVPEPPDLAALHAELEARWGGFGTGGMVVVDDPKLDEALTRTAAIEAALVDFPGLSMAGPGDLLPTPAQRAERRSALPSPGELQARIDEASATVGFTPAALAGAAERALEPPGPLGPEIWTGTPMAEAVDRHVSLEGDHSAVMSTLIIPSGADVEAVVARIHAADPDAHVVIPSWTAARGVEEIVAEVMRLGGLALLGVLGMLTLRYRRPRLVLAAAAPPLAALAWAGGAATLAGMQWNAVSAATMVLVLGLGLDYGAFLIEARSGSHGPATARAVRLSALTTLAGFGTLMLARSPALSGAGLAVFAGVAGAGLVALVAIRPAEAP